MPSVPVPYGMHITRKKATSGLGNYKIASIAADTVVAVCGLDLFPGCS